MRLEQGRWVCFLDDMKEKNKEALSLEESMKLGDWLERKGGNAARRDCSYQAETWVIYTEDMMAEDLGARPAVKRVALREQWHCLSMLPSLTVSLQLWVRSGKAQLPLSA